jgi:hypothetical protein
MARNSRGSLSEMVFGLTNFTSGYIGMGENKV